MAIGTTEWLIIGGIALFLFGAPKLVDWAKSIGKAKRTYEEEVSGTGTAKTVDVKKV
jgi:TatA/E family protein of Tat protein translocase